MVGWMREKINDNKGILYSITSLFSLCVVATGAWETMNTLI